MKCVTWLAVCALLALPACSNSGRSTKVKDAAGAKPSSTAPPTTAPTATTRADGPATTAPTTVKPGMSGGGAAQAQTAFEPTAALAKTCVHKGPGDSQTIAFHTTPKDNVGYTSVYSDTSTSFSKPEYKQQGDGYGIADDSGLFSATWSVPITAPDGQVRVNWVAKGAFRTELVFRVVGPNGAC